MVSTCLLPWCSGSLKWVTSISTLKQFIICWKDKRTNAVTEMKIRILCVKTRVFKLKDRLFIVKYKIRIEWKHMPIVEQLWTHTLCLLCAFFYSHFVIHLTFCLLNSYCCIVIYFISPPYFVWPFCCWWTFGLLLVWGCHPQWCEERPWLCTSPCVYTHAYFLCMYPAVAVLGHRGHVVLTTR